MKEYLQKIDEVIQNGTYKDTWESLQQYRAPQWYSDVKLGIFIHWGVYSVPAFGSEWYSRNMYIQGTKEFEHHRKTYGEHKDFGYKDFIPMFKGENFDPEEWIGLFEEAGAQYVIPVAEHHDGFQMYDSALSVWNAKNMGPKRDVLGELTEACVRHGLVNGASSHRVEHWFFMGHGKEFDSDIKEPLKRGDLYWPSMEEPDHMDVFAGPVPTQEFLEDWLCRCCELIDKYRPKIIYFDWWIQHSSVKPYLKKFAAYYYNRAEEWGEQVVINYKQDAFAFGTAVPDVERTQFAEAKPYVWQSDTATAVNSWGYTENNTYKPVRQILCDFVDIVSKNGRLLLNVGPKADGTIPDEDKQILRAIGAWMKVNGEAIRGAKPWRVSAEGGTQVKEGGFTDGEETRFTSEDIRFTANGSSVYAICLNMQGKNKIKVRSLHIFNAVVKDVKMLGSEKPVKWSRDETGMTIETETAVGTDLPVVFKVMCD